MSDSIAGSWASLAGIEIVNDARTFAYLQNGLGPSSLNIRGNCGCPSIFDLLGCYPEEVVLDQYVDLPGLSGNYISTPDSASTSITGDIDIRVKISLDDWTPSATQYLVAKWTGGTSHSYTFDVISTGALQFAWSADGLNDLSAISSVSTGFIDESINWVRATFDADNGAGGTDTKFYTSTDGETWIQLGATVTSGAISSIFDSTAKLNVGALDDTGSVGPLAGNVYYAEIRNSIDGAVVAAFDANDTPATSATTPNTVTSSQTGEVWTINGAGWTWGNGAYTFPFFPYISEPDYVSPASDNAPWFSSDISASAGFLGFITDEFDGMQSTFDRKVTQAVGNGGVLNRSRLGTRELTWRGFLFGSTCCSVQYGLRWLTKTLSRFDTSCRDCFGDDLELLVCCPEDNQPVTGSDSPFRLLKGVGLIEGPTILSQRKTCSSGCSNGCGGSCILEVEFTLVATQPYFYSPEIPVYDCISITEGAVIPPFTDAEVECGPGDCSDVFFVTGGLCPLPELPPTAVYENSCFDDFIVPAANYYTVQRSQWPDLEEVVPVISISAGLLGIPQLQLGFYSSSSDSPCSDLSLFPPDCDVICDELSILAIPSNSIFYIDGRTRKMAVICPDGSVFPGERLTAGPWSWPTFSNNGFCLEVKYDSSLSSSYFEGACISISLVPRTF